MECVRCVNKYLIIIMCLVRGGMGREGVEWIGFYQSCGDRRSVGRVSVFWLRWCVWGVCREIGPGSVRGGVMSV